MNTNLEIKIIERAEFKILKLRGRIDASRSLGLSEAINELIRKGSYDIVLDVTEVDYISSAGVRVLIMAHRELNSLNGSFALYRPDENVSSIIKMMGLSALCDCSKFEKELKKDTNCETRKNAETADSDWHGTGTAGGLDIRVLFNGEGVASVRISGDIDKINNFSYLKEDMRRMTAGKRTVAFGLGALGPDGPDAVARAGEFLSVCGFSAYMPSDGSKKPDYIIAGPDFSPGINYLYSAACECDFSAAFAFKSSSEKLSVKLSDIVRTAHGLSGSDDLLLVITGEAAGVVGASLAVPPAASNAGTSFEGPFEFPQIRDYFKITSEPAYGGHIALCAGVSCLKKAPDSAAAKFLRPLARDASLYGHFHAAVFEFTPLKKNCADPSELISTLYEKSSPAAVLHLINDWREAAGAGETEFVSGTCWIVSISKYESDTGTAVSAAPKNSAKERE